MIPVHCYIPVILNKAGWSIASFFSRTVDAQDIFQSLSIADAEDYGKYRNQFSVIHISFNELGGMCSSYEEYVGKIERRLVRDLKNEYPEMEIEENCAIC